MIGPHSENGACKFSNFIQSISGVLDLCVNHPLLSNDVNEQNSSDETIVAKTAKTVDADTAGDNEPADRWEIKLNVIQGVIFSAPY